LAVRSSSVVSKIIAKKSKLLRDIAYVKECLLQAAEILCTENGQIFKLWVFLQNELADTVQHLAGHMECQLKNMSQGFVAIEFQFLRVNDKIYTAQLAVSSRFH
jgi:hypothetical protein